jgi:hypothetical protein
VDFQTIHVELVAMAKSDSDSLPTKDFLKYYLQFYKEGKTQEELILFLEQKYKKKDLQKTFQNYFDRAVLYVIESTNQEILPKLNRQLSPELDGLLKKIK